MSYRHAVISLLTIAILSIAAHELRSQVRAVEHRAQPHHRAPEVRVVRVDRDLLQTMVAANTPAMRDMLGLERRAFDIEHRETLDVERRLAPLARGLVSEVVLSVRTRGRLLSMVVIAEGGPRGDTR